jgi:hypothetical protein
MISKEDLILGHLKNITDSVHELKISSDKNTASLIRLEECQSNHLKITHKFLDDKIEALEDFKTNTGIHNLKELQDKLDDKNEWKKWMSRFIIALPVGIITATMALLLKGCIGN